VSTNSSEAIVVLMTAANAAEAAKLAEALVEAHLAACVQILRPISSVFLWKGTIVHQGEVLLIAKTQRSRFEEVERQVRALHSYETPEIVALPITAGSAPYLKWISDSLEPQA
jgi:periplasmic divalent cation tolerance protein